MQSTHKGFRARILTALGFGFFIDSAEDVALPMLWPAVRTALGLSYAQLGYIDSIRVIFQTFSGPFWGMLADRYNRKWILVIGTGVWGLWTSICGLATDYWQLLIIRVVMNRLMMTSSHLQFLCSIFLRLPGGKRKLLRGRGSDRAALSAFLC